MPPSHLSAKAKLLWQKIVPRRATSPERLTLLAIALGAFDRLEEVRLEIKKTGLTTTTKRSGAVHLNPLLRVEKEARAQFLQAWTALHLEFDHQLDSCMLPGDSY
jgi:P27 family predicted phage terminase small subunit